MTLPPPPPPRRDPPALPPTSARMAMGAGDHYSGSYSSNQASSSRGHGGPTIATKGEISAQAISEVAAQLGDSSLPHRYCSIKGCKAVVPGNSFFKMCEPCRNRYRSYGTTKRAKWRREKEVAVAELQKMREEEDKRRAENGLPVRFAFIF